MPGDLSADDVRRVARLARLSIPDADLADHARRLSAILAYMERLRALDLSAVEPMAGVAEDVNRLDADEPGPTLPPARVLDQAPGRHDDFFRVPKVLGEGGGA